MALHNGTGNTPIYIEVSGLDVVQPLGNLGRLQGVQPAGQAILSAVDHGDGVIQRVRSHHTQHGSEELGEVEMRALNNASAHARGPETARSVQLLRRNGPRFPGVQSGECAVEFARGRFNDRPHLGGGGFRVTNFQTGDSVEQLIAEAHGLPHRADHDHQRGCGALLPRVSKGRLDHILGGQVEVSAGRDDNGVFT